MLSDREGRWVRVIIALLDLVPAGCDPILLLACRAEQPESPAWTGSAAQLLTDLAMAQPRLSLVLALGPGELDAYFRVATETRTKALLRGTVIPIPSFGEEAILHRLGTAIPNAPARLAGPIRRLSVDGASDTLVDLFREAALRESNSGQTGRDGDEQARSAAERFLFVRLESLPETAGLFQLNATLDFRFGPSRAEVDLLSRASRLVIEVDGYYHFQDADAYRRDRRKDLELQKRGFLVVRVLADDVVRRLEDVLDTILAVVAFRREGAVGEQGEFP